jgi:hypothetical protein
MFTSVKDIMQLKASEEARIAIVFCVHYGALKVVNGELLIKEGEEYAKIDNMDTFLDTIAHNFKYGHVCKIQDNMGDYGQIIYGQFYTEDVTGACGEEDEEALYVRVTGDVELLMCCNCGSVEEL